MTEAPAIQPTRHALIPEGRAAKARVREALPEDYQQIAALQARHGLASRSRADWCALWSRNPAYLSTEEPRPTGWVVESELGTVAGFLGNVPLAYTFRGQAVRAATANSWVVDERYRGYSVRLLSTFFSQPGVDLFIFATVNAAAEAVLRPFGLHKVPSGQWDSARFWITGYEGFVRGAMLARGIPLANWLAPPVAAALWTQDWLQEKLAARSASAPVRDDVDIELCADFDARFQNFWESLKTQNRHRLLAVRDPETLAWHFSPSLQRGNARVVAAIVDGRLVAYWVVDRQDHHELGIKRLRVVDFQALDGYGHLLRTAIQWTLDRCRQEGIHVVENPGGWLDRHRIEGTVGPYRRSLKSWLFYYRARHRELAELLKAPEVWTPTSYDGDASL